MSEKRGRSAELFGNIEPFSLITDILHSLWAIVFGSLAVAMISIMFVNSRAMVTYSSNATLAIMSKRTTGYAYNNLSAARSVATSFTSILNSDVMKKMVCEDVGLESFGATANARVIGDTNLLTLSVVSNSPERTFKIICSIMKLYPELLQYASTTMVMEVLAQPQIPVRSVSGSSAIGIAKRALVLSFVVLAAAFAYLSIRHDTIKSEKDLREKLDATALGAIEYEKLKKTKRDNGKRSVLVNDATASFSFVESYKKIAAAVLKSAERNHAKVIMITSIAEHEGKSTVAANLAIAIQNQGKRVLLIDCDLRRPSQAKIFGIDVEAGTSFTDFLAGKAKNEQAQVYRDPVSNLPLLLSSKGNRDSSEFFKENLFSRFISHLRKGLDIIILDTPPTSLMADAEAIANVADISILVVQYNRKLASEINDAIDELRKYRCHMSGCILNGVRSLPGTRRKTVGGYYGYGKYGKYGRYGAYGRYGSYGRYGAYGHYAERKNPTSSAVKKTESESKE